MAGRKGLSYRIYDCENEEWVEGEYTNNQVCEIIGAPRNRSVCDFAKNGYKFNGRWKVVIADDMPITRTSWMEEWDRVRMEILKMGGKA